DRGQVQLGDWRLSEVDRAQAWVPSGALPARTAVREDRAHRRGDQRVRDRTPDRSVDARPASQSARDRLGVDLPRVAGQLPVRRSKRLAGQDTVYVEEGRFRAVPVDRPVSSQEVATGEDAEAAPEPRNVGAADAAGTVAEPASTGPGPGRRPAAHP